MRAHKMNRSSFNLRPVLADGDREMAGMFNWNRSAWAPRWRTGSQGAGHWPHQQMLWRRSHSVGGGGGGYPAEQWGAVCRDAQVVAADEYERGPGHESVRSHLTWPEWEAKKQGESEWLGGYLGLRQESPSCSFYLDTHVIKSIFSLFFFFYSVWEHLPAFPYWYSDAFQLLSIW